MPPNTQANPSCPWPREYAAEEEPHANDDVVQGAKAPKGREIRRGRFVGKERFRIERSRRLARRRPQDVQGIPAAVLLEFHADVMQSSLSRNLPRDRPRLYRRVSLENGLIVDSQYHAIVPADIQIDGCVPENMPVPLPSHAEEATGRVRKVVEECEVDLSGRCGLKSFRATEPRPFEHRAREPGFDLEGTVQDDR